MPVRRNLHSVEVSSTKTDEVRVEYRDVSIGKTVLCHRCQEISGTVGQEFLRVLMLENMVFPTSLFHF